MGEDKAKRKFKTPNTYVILFFALALVALLTWIIPGGAYQVDEAGRAIANTYQPVPANQQGLWDIIMAPIIGMVGSEQVAAAITISLNVMLFGSFLQMMDESGAINLALRNVAIKYQDNYFVLITVLTFLMGIFGTVQGAYEEGFVYLLMFLPIILGLGLDTITALMIVIFGTQSGCIASIVNPFSTGIASGIAGISPGEGIIQRAIIFIIIMSFVSFLICLYAKKVKENPEKSVQFQRRQKDIAEFASTENNAEKLSKRQKKVFVIFILTFVIMITSLVPWTSLNKNWTFFQDITEWSNNNTILGSILGSDLVPFGDWYFNEINGLLIVMTILAGIVMGFSINKTINILIKGAAGLVSTAFIVPLARGIQVIMTDGNITATILHFAEKTLATLNPLLFIVIAFLVYILLASFIPSSTGLAAATISIMAPLGLFAGVSEATMIIVYNFALGLVKMFVPTSIIVMTCTQAVHVDYGSWLKATWKYLLSIFGLLTAMLLVLLLI